MASADYSVLTPERVSLEYGIAGLGSRGAAAIVDTLLQFVAIGVIIVGAVVLAGLAGVIVAVSGTTRSGGATFASSVVLAITVLMCFAVALGYFMFFEIVWSGQTPGKRLLGIRVLRESGYPIRPVDAVIRNVVRIVDWLPFFYGVGALVMLFNARSKRVGDFACGTIVVREGARRTYSGPPPLQAVDESPGYALSSSDATLVRDFLVRRTTMDAKPRAALAKRLANVLAQRYHLPLESESNTESFLERLAG